MPEPGMRSPEERLAERQAQRAAGAADRQREREARLLLAQEKRDNRAERRQKAASIFRGFVQGAREVVRAVGDPVQRETMRQQIEDLFDVVGDTALELEAAMPQIRDGLANLAEERMQTVAGNAEAKWKEYRAKKKEKKGDRQADKAEAIQPELELRNTAADAIYRLRRHKRQQRRQRWQGLFGAPSAETVNTQDIRDGRMQERVFSAADRLAIQQEKHEDKSSAYDREAQAYRQEARDARQNSNLFGGLRRWIAGRIRGDQRTRETQRAPRGAMPMPAPMAA